MKKTNKTPIISHVFINKHDQFYPHIPECKEKKILEEKHLCPFDFFCVKIVTEILGRDFTSGNFYRISISSTPFRGAKLVNLSKYILAATIGLFQIKIIYDNGCNPDHFYLKISRCKKPKENAIS